MDLSELYIAIQEKDDRTVNSWLVKLIPILVAYLRATMRAEPADAKDCVQTALMRTIQKIRQDRIQNPDRLYYYLLSASRNQFLRQKRDNNLAYTDEMEIHYAVEPARQMQQLLETERMDLLRVCLEGLQTDHREFINFVMDNPDADTRLIAEAFDITENNVWTRKHRIIKLLHNCVEKKLNQ